MGRREYMKVTDEAFDLIKQLAHYGTNGVYIDEEIKVIVNEKPNNKVYLEVRILGRLVLQYSNYGLFPSDYGCYDDCESWLNIIRKKIKEEEIGLSFEELRLLYVKDGIRLKEIEEECKYVKSKIKEYEDNNKKLKNENESLEENNAKMKRINDILTVQIEELRKTIQNEARQSSNMFNNKKIVSFLYSNITTRNDLDNRHKLLRKLFHPDNFHGNSRLFQLVDEYYEDAKKFKG